MTTSVRTHTAAEGCDTCAEDCGECPDITCGNDVCEEGETYLSCPDDCDDPGPFGSCGDGICSKADDEDDDQSQNYCPADCDAPNDRCEDDFDCGAGYTCVPGGEPLGGRCVIYTRIIGYYACDWGWSCPGNLVCVQIPYNPGPGGARVCLPPLN